LPAFFFGSKIPHVFMALFFFHFSMGIVYDESQFE
jgi:hypothetical protein